MAKPKRGHKIKKTKQKKTDVPKNEQMKTLALTMEDIKAANNIGNTIFSKVMVRVESAPRRFNLLKNIVEAKGILINPKVKTQIFNASRSTFHADQVIKIRYTVLKKSQFLNSINNTGHLIFNNFI